MSNKPVDLKERYDKNWQHYSTAELDHSCHAIDELRKVKWADELVEKAEKIGSPLQWYRDNRSRLGEQSWLEEWQRLESLRPTLFEVRFAYDLHSLGIKAEYDEKTLNNTKVDFVFDIASCKLLVELLSIQQTDYVNEFTDLLSHDSKMSTLDPGTEVQKIIGKLIRKVAIEGAGKNEYIPQKFPVPQTDTFHAVIADVRGFCGDQELNPKERYQLVYGMKNFAQYHARDELDLLYDSNGKPLAGVFDRELPDEDAKLFRERIHLVGLVREQKFGAGELLQQIELYWNPFLEDSKEALEAFRQLQ